MSPSQPRLDTLLDLVALGTVADVVRLDRNNRCLVAQGLKRIRAGRMQPGVAALFAVAGRDPRQASAADFGFALGPRLNAAGRLADMTLGIECLLTDDAARAQELAALLDAINRERRKVEAGMRDDAEALIDARSPPPAASRRALRDLRPELPRRRGRHHRLAPEGPRCTGRPSCSRVGQDGAARRARAARSRACTCATRSTSSASASRGC